MQNAGTPDQTSATKATGCALAETPRLARVVLSGVSRGSIARIASGLGPRICFSPDEPAAPPAGDPPATPPETPPAGDPPAAATRPEGIPDQFWDEKDGVKFGDLVGHLNELTAFKAGEESRRAAVPEKADGYELKLPADLKFGEGEGFEFDDKDPMFALGREIAHKAGLDQAGFEGLVGMYAQMRVAETKELNAAVEANLAALGPKAAERKTAANTFLTAKLGKDAGVIFEHVLMTKAGVEHVEKLIRLVSGGGMPAFSGSGREAGKDSKIEGWADMSAAEKMAAARR